MQLDPSAQPEVRALIAKTDVIVSEAEAFKIVTPLQYADAGEVLKRIKAHAKQLEDTETGITRPINAGLKALRELFRGPRDRATHAENLVKRQMMAFNDEQERIRREEQRKADEIARKERERIEAIARETERKAREKAAEERKAAEAAAAAGRAEEAARLTAKADATEQKAADKVLTLGEQATTIVAPVIHREPPKVSGVSTREVWKFAVSNAAAVPREYLSVDETKIRKVVQALKGDTQIAGVRVYSEKQLAATTA